MAASGKRRRSDVGMVRRSNRRHAGGPFSGRRFEVKSWSVPQSGGKPEWLYRAAPPPGPFRRLIAMDALSNFQLLESITKKTKTDDKVISKKCCIDSTSSTAGCSRLNVYRAPRSKSIRQTTGRSPPRLQFPRSCRPALRHAQVLPLKTL
jgi:hypothetical protein